MLDREAERAPGERIDFVSIVTPNHLHHPVAVAALERGFDVVCDKPMTLDTAQALEIADRVESSGRLFCLTHNYTGYPMVKEARDLIASGGWARSARWWSSTRRDGSPSGSKPPARSRPRGEPTPPRGSRRLHGRHRHALPPARRVRDRAASNRCSRELTTFVPGRALDDDGNVLLRFAGGARGGLRREPDLGGRRERAAAARLWRARRARLAPGGAQHSAPALARPSGGDPAHRGPDRLRARRRRATRLPMGHPEGFIEAFANLYRDFALALDARRRGEPIDQGELDFPTVRDGVRGMRFLEAVVESARTGAWVALERAAVTAAPAAPHRSASGATP